MKNKIILGLFITYLFLGIYIEDFFLNSIWTFLLLIGFGYVGAILIGSAEVILPWVVDKIHSILVWIFNPEVINSSNFFKLKHKLENRARLYLGIPYALGVIYIFLWMWEVV